MRSRSKISRGGGSVVSVKSVKSTTGATYLRPIIKVRSGKEIEEFKKELTLDDHMISLEELAERYCTDVFGGLDRAKADELIKANGPNCLVASATTSKWIVLAVFLFGGFNTLLWAGTILTFIGYGMSYAQDKNTSTDSLYLAVVLVVVILFTGFFGFYHEATSSAIMEGFKKLVPKYATVIRNRERYVIPTEEIVLGDLVELKSGDIVPADMRLIESQNLKVDNSAITGESHAVSRGPDCTDFDPLETMNLVFFGSSVLQGIGSGIVIKCGDDTVIGRIAGLTSSIEKTETLVHKELNHFIRIITYLALAIGVAFFTASMLVGYSFLKSFSFFIAIVIANVTEGLPVCLTACTSLAAKRMAVKNCLVKHLECIETLGACNVICSDKTGTLTQNIMTASHLFYDSTERDVLTNIDHLDKENESYIALCNVAILCSTATFVDGSDIAIEKRQIAGDASESAILRIMERLEGNVEEKRKHYPKVCDIPFNSANKYQVSIHRLVDGRFLLVMKGAPERVLDRCATVLRDGETLEMNAQVAKIIKKAILTLGRMGERVLAFADFVLPDSFPSNYVFDSDRPNFPLKGLRFVGMISMIDPPRPSVPEAVSKCRTAGIRVIMVTGDHPVTAAAIAKKVGIIAPNAWSVYDIAIRNDVSISTVSEKEKMECTAAVITGADLKEMHESQLERILTIYKEIVFARTSPQQKLKIVEALQRLHMVVAVTGDGVNDSPALKKADIGIAMGITGSDVSKEAADMILLDDNFSSIVTGIEEGRLIFDNLKKSIAYLLTSNVPEIVPFMMLVTLNIPEALSVMAIIVINVGTDLWPAISLTYEPAESDIMKRHPRNPKKDKLINGRLIFLTYGQIGLIQTCASFATYFYMMAGHGFFWHKVIGIRKDWENKYNNDVKDSYGQEWTFTQREVLARKCIAGYFLSIVITQIADLLVCKTRRLSLLQQGLTNHVMNAGIMFEIFLAGIVVFVPGVNTTFQFVPIELEVLIPTLPFALFIIFYDEIRKFFIRKYPHGIVYKHTYY